MKEHAFDSPIVKWESPVFAEFAQLAHPSQARPYAETGPATWTSPKIGREADLLFKEAMLLGGDGEATAKAPRSQALSCAGKQGEDRAKGEKEEKRTDRERKEFIYSGHPTSHAGPFSEGAARYLRAGIMGPQLGAGQQAAVRGTNNESGDVRGCCEIGAMRGGAGERRKQSGSSRLALVRVVRKFGLWRCSPFRCWGAFAREVFQEPVAYLAKSVAMPRLSYWYKMSRRSVHRRDSA
ncbi:hypothetical protein MKZ38_001387 [Zalerion maritima]|uniref:Uncharacterized protein n=1 Tax=Zalerion maritima TaxID=339359 RepID=A0AAD5WTU6_9PEZI|nr:hypothetical protein MKZ38_001387 [Zalerion maritima]